MNLIGQNTPYGSVSYRQTGTGPDGAPMYTADTTLSGGVQKLADTDLANSQGMSDLQGRLLGNVSDRLSQPLDLSNSATEGYLDKLNRQTLDPQWAQLGDQNEQQLYNRGVAPGSMAYKTATDSFDKARGDSYNSAYLSNHQQAVSDLTQEYNQPLNALNALRTGSELQQPGIGPTAQTPQTGVQGTNVAGIIEQNYAQQQSAANATMGGLFGLGGSLISAAVPRFSFSDRRLKTAIRRLGIAANGLAIYAFRYVWGGPERIGHMANDVARMRPDAVFRVGDFDAVDYGVL